MGVGRGGVECSAVACVLPPTSAPPPSEELFYRLLTNHVLSEEDLVQNSYPRPTGVEGVAFIRQEVDSSVQPTPSGANGVRGLWGEGSTGWWGTWCGGEHWLVVTVMHSPLAYS